MNPTNLTDRKLKVFNLLKGIENGDPESVKVVDETKYIQHNPQTHEGSEGLATLFARLAKSNPKVEIVRLFEDNDYVFGHTVYDFESVRIGFEIFRFENNKIVEHWDNIQPRIGDMVDGHTTISDTNITEVNRSIITNFLKAVIDNSNNIKPDVYINTSNYEEHSTSMDLRKKISIMKYQTCHRVLAEGNFVLSVAEGFNDSVHTSFYDLFRLNSEKIVEHWDTTEKVPHPNEWKNNNGKF